MNIMKTLNQNSKKQTAISDLNSVIQFIFANE